MGRDKALLPYQGTTLVEWVAARVKDAAGDVALVGAPERYAHLSIPALPERYAGCGPLSGIEAALRAGRAGWNLIVACDMPGLSTALLRELLESAAQADCDVLAAAGTHPEPLCAVYHRRCLPVVESALAGQRYAVHEVLSRLSLALLPVGDPAVLRNVNTSKDWAGVCA
jgi:molybdopterin-guanine dinucleotide biosynthesis protein A